MCRNCIREHQKSFDTAEGLDFILGFITAGLLSAVATFLVTLIGGLMFFGWFLIFIGAPIAGITIAEKLGFYTPRQLSRSLFIKAHSSARASLAVSSVSHGSTVAHSLMTN